MTNNMWYESEFININEKKYTCIVSNTPIGDFCIVNVDNSKAVIYPYNEYEFNDLYTPNNVIFETQEQAIQFVNKYLIDVNNNLNQYIKQL